MQETQGELKGGQDESVHEATMGRGKGGSFLWMKQQCSVGLWPFRHISLFDGGLGEADDQVWLSSNFYNL